MSLHITLVLLASAEEVGLQLQRIDHLLQQNSVSAIDHVKRPHGLESASPNLQWSLNVCRGSHHTVIAAYASGTCAVLDSKNGTVTEVNFDVLPQHIVPAEAVYFLRQKKAHFRWIVFLSVYDKIFKMSCRWVFRLVPGICQWHRVYLPPQIVKNQQAYR